MSTTLCVTACSGVTRRTRYSPAASGPWDKLDYVARSNCYWNPRMSAEVAQSLRSAWQSRTNEAGTLIADPLFVNAAAYDFRLKPDAPVFRLGFQPWDSTLAGVYGDATWIAKAANVTYPPIEIAPAPPPASIRND